MSTEATSMSNIFCDKKCIYIAITLIFFLKNHHFKILKNANAVWYKNLHLG